MPPMSTEKATKGRTEDLYTQCILLKGNLRQTSWIPAKFAVKGRVLKLRDAQDKWDDGWVVAQTYSSWSSHRVDSLRQARRNLGSVEEGL